MPTRAHRLSALAAHPNTSADVAGRIRSSVRRHERRQSLHALASHPNTTPAVKSRIRKALSHEAASRVARAEGSTPAN